MRYSEILSESPTLKIFCDLDGVLCDFDKAIIQIFGHTIDKLSEEQWNIIYKQPAFYANLDWMPDGQLLWDSIKHRSPIILTGAPRNPNSEDEKKFWCFKHLGPLVKVIVTQADLKQKYSIPGHILIDDKPSNIEQWRLKGGTGILHKNAVDTINQLKALKII